MTVRIDSHQHFWQLGRAGFNYGWLDAPPLAAIRRDYLPEDLLPRLKAAGIEKSVFVQTQHQLEENRWVLSLAETHDFIAGVVGWVDLGSEDCESQLLEFLPHPKFVGVRHVTHDEPDDDFIVRPEVLRGLGVLERHGVPFDLLFFPRHLHHAAWLAERFPGLPLVIDHLAKPEIRDRRLERHLPAWESRLRSAARFPNVYCKLSGLVTEADWEGWRPDDLRPYVEIALDAFGAERCMYGSDWPVCELAGSYAQVHDALQEVTGQLTAEERQRVFGGTAQRFYGLPG